MPKPTGIQAVQLLAALGGNGEKQQEKSGGKPFTLATVAPGYTTGRPLLIFDGETTAGARPYPKAKGLTLAAGDRVFVALHGAGGVVLCVIE